MPLTVSLPATDGDLWVPDVLPEPAGSFAARFLFDHGGVSMPDGGILTLFRAGSGSGIEESLVRIELGKDSGRHRMRAVAWSDHRLVRSEWRVLPTGPHRIRVDWSGDRDSGQGGFLLLTVDGRRFARIDGLDTEGKTLGLVRLGVSGEVDPAISGTLLFDEYRRRLAAISAAFEFRPSGFLDPTVPFANPHGIF
ncbi:MAG: hypothetical protein R3324_13295 [Halobacteriales archaeon]|nr:hypothetical protein [Halobacteriales archaeon]